MATPAIIATLLFFSENELFSVPFQMALVAYLFLVVGIAIFRNKIAYNIKIWNIIMISYTIGLYSALVLGFVGIGALYFLFSALMITIHLKKKYAIFIFYFSLVIFIIIGVLRKNAVFSFILYKYEYFDSDRFWIYAIFSYAFLLSMIIRSIFALNANLSDTIKMLICKNKKVEQLAYYDQLTNLPNRYKFKKILEDIIVEYSKNDKAFGLIILDIDNLKLINKQSNQLVGDRIIVDLANCLKNELKEAIVISRIDGDGFAMITSVPVKDNGQYLFDKIQSACNQTIRNFPGINTLTCSVGMIDSSKETAHYEDLVNNAETALLFSKESGKNTYTIYNEVFGLKILQKENMIKELQLAVDEDGFDLAFQPIYGALSKKIYEFEVLGRWHSELYGLVSPDVFIPLLESSGLIIPYGYSMMKKALIQLKKWHEAGFDDLRIAVNISASQFSDQNFYENTISLLKEYEIKPEYLELEITESVFIYDYSYIKGTLSKLKEFGIKLALDDFGTGYSSLSYLREIPLHTLKIDKSFIDGINQPKSQKILVSSLIKLAHDLDLVVIAEGVETIEQLNFLNENECDYLQGFYLSRPLKPEDIDLAFLNCWVKPLSVLERQSLTD